MSRQVRKFTDIPEVFQSVLSHKQRKRGMVCTLPDGSIWRTDHMMQWREIQGPTLEKAGKFALGHMYRDNSGLTKAEMREMIRQITEEEARAEQEKRLNAETVAKVEEKGTHKIVDRR